MSSTIDHIMEQEQRDREERWESLKKFCVKYNLARPASQLPPRPKKEEEPTK